LNVNKEAAAATMSWFCVKIDSRDLMLLRSARCVRMARHAKKKVPDGRRTF
jgi:hypothetical protein